MAVGIVASATSGSQASVASFNISASLGTGARAGIVFVVTYANSGAAIETGVTWNGATMSLLYSAVDTDTEPGIVRAYFLDNISNGAVTVTRTNNTVACVGYAASISAAKATDAYQTITRVSSTQNTNANTSTTGTGASGEVAVDDGSPGTSSMRFAAAYTGAATPPAQGTNSTALQVHDATAFGSRFVRETTAGQGSRNVGFATGTTDDWALVAVAVRETPPPNYDKVVTATGGGINTTTFTGAHKPSAALTGGGVAVAAAKGSHNATATATGGGVATTTTVTGRQSAATATGGGISTVAYLAGRQLVGLATGGGMVTIVAEAMAVENHDATVQATGGGSSSVTVQTARSSSSTATGGGTGTLVAVAGHTAAATATGGGVSTVTSTTARNRALLATGGGVATVTRAVGHSVSAAMAGGGSLSVTRAANHTSAPVATGGGRATVVALAALPNQAVAIVTATGGGRATLSIVTQVPQTEFPTRGGQRGKSWTRLVPIRRTTVQATGGGSVVVDTEAWWVDDDMVIELAGVA